jgi:Zn-dependent protease
MLITLQEIFDLVLMWLVTTYVFLPKQPLTLKEVKVYFFWVGGGVVLHELFHKIVAISLGVNATFHAFYLGLILAVLLKLFLPFIILLPGYVSIHALYLTPLQELLISFAGPFANLLLWLGLRKLAIKRQDFYIYWASEINKLLFIFNMLPIPPLDGFKVLMALLSLI